LGTLPGVGGEIGNEGGIGIHVGCVGEEEGRIVFEGKE